MVLNFIYLGIGASNSDLVLGRDSHRELTRIVCHWRQLATIPPLFAIPRSLIYYLKTPNGSPASILSLTGSADLSEPNFFSYDP